MANKAPAVIRYWTKNLRNAIGVILIILGLFGILLPVIPGLLLIVTGFVIIDKKRERYFSEFYRNVERRLFNPLMIVGVSTVSISLATLFWMDATYTHILLLAIGFMIISYNLHEIKRYFH